MDLHSVIIRPIVTEKTARLQDDTVRKYTLEVSSIATKPTVQHAFETLYGVKVSSVRILNSIEKHRMGPKREEIRKRAATKKAIITLKKGEKAVDFLAPVKK